MPRLEVQEWPQFNHQAKDIRTDGRMSERTDGRAGEKTNGRTDGQTDGQSSLEI